MKDKDFSKREKVVELEYSSSDDNLDYTMANGDMVLSFFFFMRLRACLQECNGNEVLEVEAGAKVHKFTELALKCFKNIVIELKERKLKGYLSAGNFSCACVSVYGLVSSLVSRLSITPPMHKAQCKMLLILAALGMLSTAATGLAGGIAEMARMSHVIRERTDAFDAAGNTTAAIGKAVKRLRSHSHLIEFFSPQATQVEPLKKYFDICGGPAMLIQVCSGNHHAIQ
ncbi:vacuolar H+-pyrophosphatase [Tanacetum coccineum]|uniref:H(+)-exporting diphosphatase n=1 Tax=Tanacetum coccineum TaxID=301880 RepID=A0ABQ4XA09_9ASTR